TPTPADPWADVRRIEAWAGEVRVNLIRLAGILIFYGHHLLNVFYFRDDPTVTAHYHAAVTGVVVAWSAAVVGLHVCLSRRCLPPRVVGRGRGPHPLAHLSALPGLAVAAQGGGARRRGPRPRPGSRHRRAGAWGTCLSRLRGSDPAGLALLPELQHPAAGAAAS